MGFASLAIALAGVAAVALPDLGKYLALGLGIFAIGLGLSAYRRQDARPRTRIAGAAGVTTGVATVIIAGLKIALTWMILNRLAGLLE